MADPKLISPLRLEDRTLWFGKIKLYEDEIVISGWCWTGPVTTHISLRTVTVFEKWTVKQGPNFRINRKNGRPIFGRIETGAKFWSNR